MCVPQCNGKQCGSDGCGGSCGACGPNQACSGANQCVCVPNCAGKQCGSDGCGGSCGTCATNQACSNANQCVCVPQCNGKSCGPDGCGGQCGTCPPNSTCNGSGTGCTCLPGYVPNPQGTGCLKVGGACGGVSQYGYCSGDSWVRCDATAGIVVMPCGAGQCRTINAQGEGACRCGGVTQSGVCAAADGTQGNTSLFWCATAFDILVATNCKQETGSSAGFCSTFVTSFGWENQCYCNTCSYQLGNTCQPLCSGSSTCSYNAPGNFHTCN